MTTTTTKKQGYYIFAYNKDCFIETSTKRRTKELALTFLNGIQNRLNRFTNITEKDIEYVQKNMQPATLELHTIKEGNFKGLRYITIEGDNFSFGCDVCENPHEMVVIV